MYARAFVHQLKGQTRTRRVCENKTVFIGLH